MMRGLWLERGRLSLRADLPEPPARDGWTRVAVRRAGICATDQALARGYMQFTGVPGHEFVGEALDGPLRGRRVVGEINAGCGDCEPCRRGDPRHCVGRTVLGIAGLPGAFAERLALPTANLLPVPDEVGDDEATFTEPLAAALHVGDDVDLDRHRSALVAGDGKLGMLCAWVLAAAGCDVTLAGRHAARQAIAGPRVRHVTGWLEAGPQAAAVEAFDLAVDATGSADVLPRLLRCVRARGTLVLKTTTERPASFDAADLVVRELRLVGSRCGRFAPALAALRARTFPVSALVQATFALDDGAAAFAAAAERGALKVLLRP